MKNKRFFLVLMVALCLLSGSWGLSADCNTYTDSIIEYHNGEAFCSGFGPGCTECTNSSGGSCVTNGTECTPKNGPFQQT